MYVFRAPSRMDSVTSAVQYICVPHSTIWPGHCKTHSILGSVAYAS